MLAIAITVGGIYVLIKGQVSLTKTKIVKGWRARVIGAILVSYFPLALGLGILLGIYCAINQIEFPQGQAIFIDLGVIAVCCVLAFILGMAWGKPQHEWDQLAAAQYAPIPSGPVSYPPPSDNPYQPPHIH